MKILEFCSSLNFIPKFHPSPLIFHPLLQPTRLLIFRLENNGFFASFLAADSCAGSVGFTPNFPCKTVALWVVNGHTLTKMLTP